MNSVRLLSSVPIKLVACVLLSNPVLSNAGDKAVEKFKLSLVIVKLSKHLSNKGNSMGIFLDWLPKKPIKKATMMKQ